MDNIKNILLGWFFLFLIYSPVLRGQTLPELSLKDAYTLLEKRYPLLKNGAVLQQINEKEKERLEKSRLPGLNLKADGTLRSDRPQLEVDEGFMLPFEINQPFVSAKAYIEANYIILDGGVTKAQKQLQDIRLKADMQDLEVDRFALRTQVNQLFLNLITLKEQTALIDLSIKDLNARKETIAAGVEYGVLLPSELTRLQVKELELKAQKENILYTITGMVNSLNQLLDIELTSDTELVLPLLPMPSDIPPIDRPEQAYFKLQRQAILAQSDLIDASQMPKLGVFAQGGVAYPNPFNFFDNTVGPFGLIGAEFSWPITDWKKSKTEKEILSLQTQKLKHAEETFEFNLQTREAAYLAEVDRINAQIKQDQKIAQLQGEILEQLAAQLEEGVITSADYVIQVNAELKARQKLLIHQIELVKVQVEFWNERGAF